MLWCAPRVSPGKDFDLAFVQHPVHFDELRAVPGERLPVARVAGAAEDVGMIGIEQDRVGVLAGGLNAENIGDAVAATGTQFVDVNSGVEAAPGRKDPEKLKAFAAAMARAVKPATGSAAE